MPETTLEVARRAMDAFNRRDLEGWLDALDPDVEFVDHLSLNPNSYRGHAAAAQWFRGWDKVWEDIQVDNPRELRRGADDDVWRFSARARGTGSGAVVTQDFWMVTRSRAGRFTRVEAHLSEADAFAAAAISD